MIRNICYIRRKLEGQAEELMARAAALEDLFRLEDINTLSRSTNRRKAAK